MNRCWLVVVKLVIVFIPAVFPNLGWCLSPLSQIARENIRENETEIVERDDVREVVYGEDNRSDISEYPAFYSELARSVAAMIRKRYLSSEGRRSTDYKLKTKDFSDHVCPDQRFSNQITASHCTGFLVAPDVLVTAGHCMRSRLGCMTYAWVFDFRQDLLDSRLSQGEDPLIPAKNIYYCRKILEQKMDTSTKEDYAVIQLDRPVQDRAPLEIRKTGKVRDADPVFVIGHPSGLPTKIADKAQVRRNDQEAYFVINADTFAGNSGSPVFHAKTGVVEGILVRGESDFTYDEQRKCKVINQCQNHTCQGEDAMRMTKIEMLKNL